ncbi:hypothetical protein K438DRAFT_2003968 [Mycena galopus ATCC 62051]|nr:hypothetical protein K438DRAFT_2003968 [Mycena galopus ATCC 62051]
MSLLSFFLSLLGVSLQCIAAWRIIALLPAWCIITLQFYDLKISWSFKPAFGDRGSICFNFNVLHLRGSLGFASASSGFLVYVWALEPSMRADVMARHAIPTAQFKVFTSPVTTINREGRCYHKNHGGLEGLTARQRSKRVRTFSGVVVRRTHKLEAHQLIAPVVSLPCPRLVAPAPTTSGLGPEIPPCRAASGAAERLRGRPSRFLPAPAIFSPARSPPELSGSALGAGPPTIPTCRPRAPPRGYRNGWEGDSSPPDLLPPHFTARSPEIGRERVGRATLQRRFEGSATVTGEAFPFPTCSRFRFARVVAPRIKRERVGADPPITPTYRPPPPFRGYRNARSPESGGSASGRARLRHQCAALQRRFDGNATVTGEAFPFPTCSRFRFTRAVATRIKRERVGGGPTPYTDLPPSPAVSRVAQPLSFVPADNTFLDFVDSPLVSGATRDALFGLETFTSTSRLHLDPGMMEHLHTPVFGHGSIVSIPMPPSGSPSSFSRLRLDEQQIYCIIPSMRADAEGPNAGISTQAYRKICVNWQDVIRGSAAVLSSTSRFPGLSFHRFNFNVAQLFTFVLLSASPQPAADFFFMFGSWRWVCVRELIEERRANITQKCAPTRRVGEGGGGGGRRCFGGGPPSGRRLGRYSVSPLASRSRFTCAVGPQIKWRASGVRPPSTPTCRRIPRRFEVAAAVTGDVFHPPTRSCSRFTRAVGPPTKRSASGARPPSTPTCRCIPRRFEVAAAVTGDVFHPPIQSCSRFTRAVGPPIKRSASGARQPSTPTCRRIPRRFEVAAALTGEVFHPPTRSCSRFTRAVRPRIKRSASGARPPSTPTCRRIPRRFEVAAARTRDVFHPPTRSRFLFTRAVGPRIKRSASGARPPSTPTCRRIPRRFEVAAALTGDVFHPPTHSCSRFTRVVGPRIKRSASGARSPSTPTCRCIPRRFEVAAAVTGDVFHPPNCSRSRLTRAVGPRIKRERVGGGPTYRPPPPLRGYRND